MRTIETKVYTFDELSEAAKEQARNWYREAGFDGWYESTYDDAENIGLKIKAFDLDRRAYVKAEFLHGALECAHAIEKEHGETCETFKTATEFLKERDSIVDQAERDENGDVCNNYDLDQDLDACEAEFLKAISEDYRINLQREWDYVNSNESIDENIRCNEYEFTEDGERALESVGAA